MQCLLQHSIPLCSLGLEPSTLCPSQRQTQRCHSHLLITQLGPTSFIWVDLRGQEKSSRNSDACACVHTDKGMPTQKIINIYI